MPWSTLVSVPTCPTCERVFFGIEDEGRAFRTRLSCRAKGCRQEWWVMALMVGATLPQLCMEIADPFIAVRLLEEYGLPTLLDRPMFWQLSLDSHQAYQRRRAIENARAGGPAVPPFPLSLRARSAVAPLADESLS
jgi:hypothetical protein